MGSVRGLGREAGAPASVLGSLLLIVPLEFHNFKASVALSEALLTRGPPEGGTGKSVAGLGARSTFTQPEDCWELALPVFLRGERDAAELGGVRSVVGAGLARGLDRCLVMGLGRSKSGSSKFGFPVCALLLGLALH
jgi:hypothetical protein